jgi:hypothetical protein
MKSHTNLSQPMMLIIEKYRDKVLDQSFFPSTPTDTLYARITATYLLSNASPEEVSKAADLINRTSTNVNDLARLAALSAKVTYWESLNVIETDGDKFCQYSLTYQNNNGRETVGYHASYLTENHKCCFTTQIPMMAQGNKKPDSLTVTKGGFHFLTTKYQSPDVSEQDAHPVLRSKL